MCRPPRARTRGSAPANPVVDVPSQMPPSRRRPGARCRRLTGAPKRSCPHQRAEAREQRRELFGRRLRARVERVLHDAARRRIDDDGDAIDGRLDRVRLEVEERERAQRTHLAHRRRQFQAPATSSRASRRRSRMCSTAAPRSRRSRRVDSGSSRRVSTKDNGSRSAIGHSRSSDASNRSSSSIGTSGRMIFAARDRLPRQPPARPSRETRSAVGRDATSPSVFKPQRLERRSYKVRSSKNVFCLSFSTSRLSELFEKRERQRRKRGRLFSRRDRPSTRDVLARAATPPSACGRRRRARARRGRRLHDAALRRSPAPTRAGV